LVAAEDDPLCQELIVDQKRAAQRSRRLEKDMGGDPAQLWLGGILEAEIASSFQVGYFKNGTRGQ